MSRARSPTRSPWPVPDPRGRRADGRRATTLGDLRGWPPRSATSPATPCSGPPARPQVGYVPAGSEEPYVLLDGARTRSLFDSVIEDTACRPSSRPESAAPAEEPAAGTEPPPAAGAGPADAGALTVAPAEVTVDVRNATGDPRAGRDVADELRGAGLRASARSATPGTVNQTVVRHGPARGAGPHRRRRRSGRGAAGQRPHRRHRAAGHRPRLRTSSPCRRRRPRRTRAPGREAPAPARSASRTPAAAVTGAEPVASRLQDDLRLRQPKRPEM